ncbi:MAG TPA: tRNA (adenosine(37)-N6)-threonylcarbamoyltransferase complex ATPase subunit type 1 TsaE [Parvibaculum sp.]
MTSHGDFASYAAMPAQHTPGPEKEPGIRLPLPDEAATGALGAGLAALVRPGDFIALSGDLGAGKTALARALIQARLARHGLEDDVPSPTFTLVQGYETPDLLLTHVDLYRLDRPEDAAELGLADALDEGVVLVEWPEKLAALPADRLDIELVLMPEGRREARLTGHGVWSARLAELKGR